MVDDTSMSIDTAAQTALESPNDAAAAIQTLFDYVEDDSDDASSAATALALVAGRAPAAFDSQTDSFESALETASGVHTRRNLAEAINELLDQHAIPPEDAGPALSEVTRVRDHPYWQTRPKDGLNAVRKGWKGWTTLATRDEMIPEVVVERAVGFINYSDLTTLIIIIDLLKMAIASGSPGTEMAFESLVEFTTVDDGATLISEATIAIAELVLSGDIPDEDTAHDVLTANAKAAQRDTHIVEQALAELST